MRNRPAFTIIEVLIAIALMGIILPALYETVALLRNSNNQLFEHLEKEKKARKVFDTLYLDLLSSDGNITIKKNDFSRVCIENTKNSLYGLSSAKVCWLVMKEDNTLVRVEGYGYSLPTGIDEKVEVDQVMKDMALFDLYYAKDKILVLLKSKKEDAVTFMVQGVSKPKKKKKKKSKRSVNKKVPGRNTPNLPPQFVPGTQNQTPK